MKKKISFVTTSLVRSGAERVTVLLAEYFHKIGYDVEIIMMLYHTREIEVSEGIKIVDFAGNTESRIRRIPFWLKKLKKHFKERKPDIVVSFIARINIFTLLSIKDKDCRVIISERNDPRHDSRTFFTKILINLLYPKADAIVFQTETALKLFNNKIQSKGVVISNPINIYEYAGMDNYSDNLITFAGRYSEQKNIKTIIDAAEIVSEKIPNIRFELYGSGPDKDMLEEYKNSKHLQNNVFINDNIPDVFKKMRESYLFVMSSLYEGMSNSLLEATFSGVPCLTTPVLGSDVIKDGVNGFFFGFRDSEKLANLIIKLKNDDEYYRQIRFNSIKTAKSIKHQNIFEQWSSVLEDKY